MAQQKKGDRATGPLLVDGRWKYRYPAEGYPGYWLVSFWVAGPDGKPKQSSKRHPFTDPGEEAAELARAQAMVDELNCAAKLAAGTTIGDAIDHYPAYLAAGDDKLELEPKSKGAIKTDVYRLKSFFDEASRTLPVADLTEADCRARYEAIKASLKFDTVYGTMSVVKKFLAWCVRQRWARANVAEGIRAKGQKNDGGKGKKQLNFDHLAKWQEKAFELAEQGDDSAVAALLTIHSGLRESLIVSRRVGDVDMEGAVLWVREAQPNRTKRVPSMNCILEERLWAPLLSLTLGRDGKEWLFAGERTRLTGHRHRDWVTDNIRRICRLAGVPDDTHAHGMRGAGMSLENASGEFLAKIQARKGHGMGSAVTRRAYLSAESIAKRRQRNTMMALAGGKAS